MSKEHQTIKIWKSTLKNLRLIYAESGVPMIKILDEMITREVDRVNEIKTPTNTGKS